MRPKQNAPLDRFEYRNTWNFSSPSNRGKNFVMSRLSHTSPPQDWIERKAGNGERAQQDHVDYLKAETMASRTESGKGHLKCLCFLLIHLIVQMLCCTLSFGRLWAYCTVSQKQLGSKEMQKSADLTCHFAKQNGLANRNAWKSFAVLFKSERKKTANSLHARPPKESLCIFCDVDM